MSFFYDPTTLTALLAAIGACASAVATFRSVKEMKKQRESSYQPELKISFFSVCGKNTGDFFHVDPVKAHILNLGLGAAKDIHITFTDNIGDLIPKINTILADKSCGYSFSKGEELRLDHKFSDGGLISNSVSLNNQLWFNYALPGKQENYEFNIPYSILYFVDFLIKKSFEDEFLQLRNYINQLCMYVATSYYDIGGNLIRKNFTVRIVDYVYDYQNLTYIARFM